MSCTCPDPVCVAAHRAGSRRRWLGRLAWASILAILALYGWALSQIPAVPR